MQAKFLFQQELYFKKLTNLNGQGKPRKDNLSQVKLFLWVLSIQVFGTSILRYEVNSHRFKKDIQMRCLKKTFIYELKLICLNDILYQIYKMMMMILLQQKQCFSSLPDCGLFLSNFIDKIPPMNGKVQTNPNKLFGDHIISLPLAKKLRITIQSNHNCL